MKLLFFTYDFPYPTDSGGKTRAFNLLKERVKDIDVTLFSFTRSDFKENDKKGLEEIGIKKIYSFPRKKLRSLRNLSTVLDHQHSIFYKLYYDPVVEQQLHQVIEEEKIDVVHFESYYTGFYISKKIRRLGAKQILGTENIEANIYSDYIRYSVSPLFKPFYNRECRKIRGEEEVMMKNSDLALSVTPSEKEFIENISHKKCFVIENGVDLKKFPYNKRENNGKKTILFVGNFTYFPNSDAIDFFYHSVFKRMEDRDLKLRIIGKGSSKLDFVNDPRVKIDEHVIDIVSAYKDADIFVSPIRIGGGTNFKILESMALGLPVIAFPHRMQDLGVQNRKEIIIAQNEKEYIDSIYELLDNKDLVESVTRNARRFIEERYSWETIGRKMNGIWKSV